jgi:hypothetical protein
MTVGTESHPQPGEGGGRLPQRFAVVARRRNAQGQGRPLADESQAFPAINVSTTPCHALMPRAESALQEFFATMWGTAEPMVGTYRAGVVDSDGETGRRSQFTSHHRRTRCGTTSLAAWLSST